MKPPSYPKYKRLGDLAVRFTVPNQAIADLIFQHSNAEFNLRLRAAGNILYPRIQRLARILGRHRIQIDEMSAAPNEMCITMFLPPPPCPAPKPGMFRKFKRHKLPSPGLATIQEGDETDADVWITLYEYHQCRSTHSA